MKKQFIIVDGNSLGNRAQNTGKPLTIGDMQTQAIYHFLIAMRSYLSRHSLATPVVLWDGMSWRKSRYIAYKENRDREDTEHEKKQAEMRRHYRKQQPIIQKALSFLGVTQVSAENMEADDLAAIMADLYAGQGSLVTLLTEDKDWLQLIQNGVAMERPITGDRITTSNFTEVTGVRTPQEFVMVKAMMGDQGDNIKGLGNVGEKRAIKLIEEYGSFGNLLESVMIRKTVDPAKLPKYLRDIVENEEKALAYDFNMSLVDLRHPARPPVENLMVNPGKPSAENFRQLCDLLLFKSFTDQFDVWIEAFPVGKQALLAA